MIYTCFQCLVIAPLFGAPSSFINTHDSKSFLHPTITRSSHLPSTSQTYTRTVCSLSSVFASCLPAADSERYLFFCPPQLIMSAAERVQSHPVYVQAQGKASYYVNQLDKEVTSDLQTPLPPFSDPLLTRCLTAQQLPYVEGLGGTHSSSQVLHGHRLRRSPPPSPHLQLVRCTRF